MIFGFIPIHTNIDETIEISTEELEKLKHMFPEVYEKLRYIVEKL